MAGFDWVLEPDEETGVTRKRLPQLKHKRSAKQEAELKGPGPTPKPPKLPATFFRDIFNAGLSPQEADVVAFLHSVRLASIYDLSAALFGRDARGMPHMRAHTRVVLSHIRQKLRPFGYTIHTPIGGWSGHKTSSVYFLKPLEGADDQAR